MQRFTYVYFKQDANSIVLIVFKGLLVGGKFRDALPLVVMGVPAMAVGLLVLWLPETRNRPLPETLEDLENFRRYAYCYAGMLLHPLYSCVIKAKEVNHFTVPILNLYAVFCHTRST